MLTEKRIESENTNLEVPKHEVKLHFHWFLLSFFIVYLGSLIVAGVLFILFFIFLFYPKILLAENFLAIISQLDSLLILLITPIVFLFCYLLRLFLIALITRVLWAITEKRSPSRDGIIPRNIHSKTLNYYHLRSFIIKYPKYMFSKGLFPWLTTWLYNFVKTNSLGKGTTIEEQVCADKYLETGKNVYIGVNSVLTSHVVEGIFGNISNFKIKIGENVTMGGWNATGPGGVIGDNSVLLPAAHAGKHFNVLGKNYYFGVPMRKLTIKKIQKYLALSPEQIKLGTSMKINQEIPRNIQEDNKNISQEER
ncbi:MAG: hypothetical protein JW891_09245 [Candidatus Lokiarchaeota archaeon]|nr:hypothetical protein [Candidatus Lokiarchaeota archaeon]